MSIGPINPNGIISNEHYENLVKCHNEGEYTIISWYLNERLRRKIRDEKSLDRSMNGKERFSDYLNYNETPMEELTINDVMKGFDYGN